MRIGKFSISHANLLGVEVHVLHEVVHIHADIVLIVGQIDAFDFFLGNINRYL